MDKLRKNILNVLQDDARYTPAKVATLVGADEAVVAKEIAALESEGIIVKYSAIVNTEKTGEDYVDALIEIKVNPQPRSGYDAIAEQIIKFDEVKDVYLMSGAFDLVVIIEARTIREVSMFVSDKLSVIEGIKGASTHFILKKYKESGVNLQDTDKSNRISLHE